MALARGLGCFIPSGQFDDGGHVIFEPYRRADTTAGMTIRNPRGEEPWVLDVLSVGPPDADGMVTLATVQGPIRICRDWPCDPYTQQDADFAALLLTDLMENPPCLPEAGAMDEQVGAPETGLEHLPSTLYFPVVVPRLDGGGRVLTRVRRRLFGLSRLGAVLRRAGSASRRANTVHIEDLTLVQDADPGDVAGVA